LYTPSPDYVRTPDELTRALSRLAASDCVALDTEFLRERTYFAKLCLVQLAVDDYCALIDVLAFVEQQPLFDFLNDRARIKVLHAAHQDLEVLAFAQARLLGVNVAPIAGPFFDTQVAAGFSGLPAQIGYGELVQQRLQHTLDKAQARTDWSKRPLSDAQIRYAADDVRYLVELYRDFERALKSAPFWQWMAQDAQSLADPNLYVTAPEEAWKRLRGLERLTPPQRAAAKALAAWRERRAIDKDLPRGWILSDEALRQLADRLPTVEAMTEIRELPKSLIEKRGAELARLIADAAANAANEPHVAWEPPPRAQVKKVSRLMDWIRQESARHKISPELLATRREVEQLVFNGKLGEFGQGWRRELFGQRLIELAAQET